MFQLGSMRIDDPLDNAGRGWRRLSADEVAELAYLAIRLSRPSVRKDLAGRNAAKADEAARWIAKAVSGRLRAYPTFGPGSLAASHSTIGKSVP